MPEPTREQRIAELADAAEILSAGVRDLAKDTGGQLVTLSKSARFNRFMTLALAVLFALHAGLTLYVVGLSKDVRDAQELTRSQVLCPLYQQFINADTTAARDLAKRNGQDLAERDRAFRVIRDSYAVLKCEEVREVKR